MSRYDGTILKLAMWYRSFAALHSIIIMKILSECTGGIGEHVGEVASTSVMKSLTPGSSCNFLQIQHEETVGYK